MQDVGERVAGAPNGLGLFRCFGSLDDGVLPIFLPFR